jgi:GNAT superfamily N-acetyltransferase
LRSVFGTYCASRCLCQRYKIRDKDRRSYTPEMLADRLREQTCCDDPASPITSGLVAYREGQPVGWCAVEPRNAYLRLREGNRTNTAWAGRDEDRDDPTVWAITCFLTRKGHRKTGVADALARAAIDFARTRGAAAIEGYAIVLPPGDEIAWDEPHVGPLSVYEEAGFRDVALPSKRRAVMRIDF